MPKYPTPKYSDRLNFFFVINGKKIPMKKRFSIIDKLQSKINGSRKQSKGLVGALSLAATIERDSNSATQCETRIEHIQEVRLTILQFFSCAEKVLEDFSVPEVSRIDALVYLLASTVAYMNQLFEVMDNSWLVKYGTISSEYLEYKSPLDFLEVLPVAEKILGKGCRRVVENIGRYQGAMRNRYTIATKPSFVVTIHHF